MVAEVAVLLFNGAGRGQEMIGTDQQTGVFCAINVGVVFHVHVGATLGGFDIDELYAGVASHDVPADVSLMVRHVDAIVVGCLCVSDFRLVGAEPAVNLLRHEEYHEEEAQDSHAQDDSNPSQQLLALSLLPTAAMAVVMMVVMMMVMVGTLAVPRTVI